MPGNVLGAKDKHSNEQKKNLCSHEAYILTRRERQSIE